jgi:hypothetical protein
LELCWQQLLHGDALRKSRPCSCARDRALLCRAKSRSLHPQGAYVCSKSLSCFLILILCRVTIVCDRPCSPHPNTVPQVEVATETAAAFFPSSDGLESLVTDEWFTTFVLSREPCDRVCAEIAFADPTVKFYCSGTCDSSGKRACVCDEVRDFHENACQKTWGSKMCNCTRSSLSESVLDEKAAALVSEPAFQVCAAPSVCVCVCLCVCESSSFISGVAVLTRS